MLDHMIKANLRKQRKLKVPEEKEQLHQVLQLKQKIQHNRNIDLPFYYIFNSG